MKWQIFILTILICTSSYGQAEKDSINHQMMVLELRAFNEVSDTLKHRLFYEKMKLYVAHRDFGQQAYLTSERIRYSFLNDSLEQATYLWNAVLLARLNKDVKHSNYYYNQYFELTSDTSSVSILLGLLVKAELDTTSFYSFLRAQNWEEKGSPLECLVTFPFYELSGKKWYQRASMLLPGSGTIAAGDWKNGLSSTIVMSASVYGVIALFKSNMYFNSIFWTASMLPRLYGGNLKLTYNAVSKLESKNKLKLANACAGEIKTLLNQYPIDFR